MLAAIWILVFVSTVCFAWALLPDASRRAVHRRVLSEVELPEAKRPSPLSPLVSALGVIHRRLPLRAYSEQTTRMLESAGLRLPPLHFLVLQEMGALTGLMLYFATMGGK